MEIRLAKTDPEQRLLCYHEGKFFFGLGVVDRQPLPASVSWLTLGIALRRLDPPGFWGSVA